MAVTVLSIGMIVKNEEAKLAQTLQALQPLRDGVKTQLVIVDTGSTDRTMEIARGFTREVFAVQWENDFAKARNQALRHARGEWFFFLDADEVLTDCQELITFLRSDRRRRYNCAQLKVRNLTSSRRDAWQEGWVLRLFRIEEGVRFYGAVHERPNWRPPKYTLQQTHLVHSGYDNDDKSFLRQKAERNVSLMERMLAGEVLAPDRRVQLLLDCVDSLMMGFFEPGRIIQTAEEAIALTESSVTAKRQRALFLSRAYAQLNRHYCNHEQWADCLQASQAYWQSQPLRDVWDMDICGLEGMAAFFSNQLELAIERLEAYQHWLPQDKSRVNFVLATTEKAQDFQRMLETCRLLKQAGSRKVTVQHDCKPIKIEQVIAVIAPERALWQQAQDALLDDPEKAVPALGRTHEGRAAILQEARALCGRCTAEQGQEIAAALGKLGGPQEELMPVMALYAAEPDAWQMCLSQLPDGLTLALEDGAVIGRGLALQADMAPLWPHLVFAWLPQYLDECCAHYPDLSQICYAYYVQRQPEALVLAEHALGCQLLGYCLLHLSPEEGLRQRLYPLTIAWAYSYLKRLYRLEDVWRTPQLLPPEAQCILLVKQGLDLRQGGDWSGYLQAMRQAVARYPQARAAIAAEAAFIEDNLAAVRANEELTQLACAIKGQIQALWDQGQPREACALLAQLAALIPDDPDVVRWQEVCLSAEIVRA